MRRGRINTHNPLSPPEHYDYIQVLPEHVKEALEAYDQWNGKQRLPPMVRELILVLSIEVERVENSRLERSARSNCRAGLEHVPDLAKKKGSGPTTRLVRYIRRALCQRPTMFPSVSLK